MAKAKSKNEELEQEPRNIEAENGVLGSILLKYERFDDIASMVDVSDFYDPANQTLFRHLQEMHTAGKRVDNTLLKDRLVKAGDYESIGGIAYLAELTRSVPHAGHAEYYAKIVRDASTQRKMIKSGREIIAMGFANDREADDALAKSEELLANVRDQRMASFERTATISEVLAQAIAEIDKRAQGTAMIGLETGFSDLDQKLLLREGDLIIIAGRPSMGKSALAAAFALNVAMYEGKPVVFASLEMSAAQLAERMIATIGKVDSESLARGKLTADERARTVEAVGRLSQLPILIDDSPDRSVRDIAAVCRRHKRKHGLGLVVVDYLQLVTATQSRDENREQQVSQMSKAFKHMAREMKVPVVVLAQLNRQAENTRDQRPRLSHLRESGAIEQDADVVLFVHRPEYFLTPEDRQQALSDGDPKGQLNMAEVIIGKQRNGAIGTVNLEWAQAWTRFDDYRRNPANYEPFFDQYETHT